MVAILQTACKNRYFVDTKVYTRHFGSHTTRFPESFHVQGLGFSLNCPYRTHPLLYTARFLSNFNSECSFIIIWSLCGLCLFDLAQNFVKNSLRVFDDAAATKLWVFLDGVKNDITREEKDTTDRSAAAATRAKSEEKSEEPSVQKGAGVPSASEDIIVLWNEVVAIVQCSPE